MKKALTTSNKKWLSTVSATVLAIAVTTPAAFAQSGPIQLPGIVIESASLSGEETDISETGTSATVVTEQEIEDTKSKEVIDVLRTVPGLSVNRSGAAGGVTEVRIRGAEANHTLVLIDGIEANSSSDGGFDFSSLDANSIERVEVLRGPQSGLYGSKAIGGVINIITKNGKGPAETNIQLEAGSFDTVGAKAYVGGGNERIYGALTLAGRRTNGTDITRTAGIDEIDGYQNRSAFFKGGVSPTEDLNLEIIGRIQHKDDESDSPSSAFGVDTASRVLFDEQFGSARLTHTMFNKLFRHRAWTNYQKRNVGFVSSFGLYENFTDRRTYGYDASLKINNAEAGFSSRLTGRIDHNDETYSATSSATGSQKRTGYALEYAFDFYKRTFLTASVRHDTVDVFKDATTYRLAATHKFTQTGTRLHASYGTGLKLPTLIEQFGFAPGVFQGNPNLLPEESTGWDIGAEQTFANGKAKIDVTYFQNQIENRIASSGQFARNILGQSENQGVEVALTARPVPGVSFKASYTYLDAEDPNGLQSVRRPEHSASLSTNIAFAQGRGNFNVTAKYVSQQQDTDFRNFLAPVQVTLDDYVKVDIAARYRLTEQAEIYGRVENLFNQDYQEVFLYDAPGIAAYAGIKLKFGGEASEEAPLK